MQVLSKAEKQRHVSKEKVALIGSLAPQIVIGSSYPKRLCTNSFNNAYSYNHQKQSIINYENLLYLFPTLNKRGKLANENIFYFSLSIPIYYFLVYSSIFFLQHN